MDLGFGAVGELAISDLPLPPEALVLPLPVFPSIISQGWSTFRKITYSSYTSKCINGRETRLQRAVYPIVNFTLTFGGDTWLRDQTQNNTPDVNHLGYVEFEELSGIFLQSLGPYGEFLYYDPEINATENIPLGFGNGSNTTFQFIGSFSAENTTYAFPLVTFPVGCVGVIIDVYVNNVSIGSAYVVNANRTQIQLTTAPSNGALVTASYSYYFRCRFMESQPYEQWAKNLWENKQVQFVSVKP